MINPQAIAFDDQGNLWVADYPGMFSTGQIQMIQGPLSSITSSPQVTVTLTEGVNQPVDFAIWPPPPGLPLY